MCSPSGTAPDPLAGAEDDRQLPRQREASLPRSGTSTAATKPLAGKARGSLLAKTDLLGEMRNDADGTVVFQRGITRYPVIGDGAQAALPTRLRFSELPAHVIPRSESELRVRVASNRGIDMAFIRSVVER